MSGCHGRISIYVMKNEGSSSEIPSVRKCHRPLRKKGGVKRLADEDVSVPGGRGGADPGRGTERLSERFSERFFEFVSILF